MRQLVGRRYEIRSKIGAGGMGEVYLAQDAKLDRKVALKILPAEVAADRNRMSRFVQAPRLLRRFEQEALATSALNYPNIGAASVESGARRTSSPNCSKAMSFVQS